MESVTISHPVGYSSPNARSWAIKSATYPDNEVSDIACGVLADARLPLHSCVGVGQDKRQAFAAFRYNPVTDTIESIASPWPGDSDGITLPVVAQERFNNKLYILGGFRINTAMTNQIWEFDPTNNLWVQRISLPVPRIYTNSNLF